MSKIFVLSHHETKATLEKYFDIDSIPKHYGGQLDWEYGQYPAVDPEVRERLGDAWIKGPVRWEGQVVPVGTVEGKERPRPPPLPKDQIPQTTAPPPYVTDSAPPTVSPQTGANPQKAHIAASEADYRGQSDVATATNGVAAVTINGEDEVNAELAATVATNGVAAVTIIGEEKAPVELPSTEPALNPPTNGVQKLPSNNTDALASAIRHEELKLDAQTNGVAKPPPLERFSTAAEQLPTST